MKRPTLIAVLAIAATWYVVRGRLHARDAAPVPPHGASGDDVPAVGTTEPADRAPVGPHVTQLASPAERRAVADRIATSREQRKHAAIHVAAPPSVPILDPADLPAVSTTLRAAMREVLPHLANCYENSQSYLPDDITVTAKLTLTGDPDVGTLIDAHELEADSASVPLAFDDCMRGVLQNVELPPLAEGDMLNVTYPFTFRR